MKDGQPQRSDTRLFMQFLAFGGCPDAGPLTETVAKAGIAGVLYQDVNDPRGVALLTFDQDPAFFVDRVRPIVNAGPFAHGFSQPPRSNVGSDLFPLLPLSLNSLARGGSARIQR